MKKLFNLGYSKTFKPKVCVFGTAALDLYEKVGANLRFDRPLFQELVPKPIGFWNKLNLLGIITIVVIIGFSVTACGKDTLDGKWAGEDGTIVFENSNFSVSTYSLDIKGKYTVNGNNMTLITEEVKGSLLEMEMGLSSNVWYTKDTIIKAIVDLLVSYGLTKSDAEMFCNEDPNIKDGIGMMFSSQNATYLLKGDTLSITVDGDTSVYARSK